LANNTISTYFSRVDSVFPASLAVVQKRKVGGGESFQGRDGIGAKDITERFLQIGAGARDAMGVAGSGRGAT
jgi:hypothetical protein